MRRNIFLLFVLLFSLPSLCWSAVSCVQETQSENYKATNQASNCVVPESFASHVAPVLALSHSGNLNFSSSSPSNANAVINLPSNQSTWDLRVEDGSVYAALKRWSTVAGWQISWEIPVDFPIEIVDRSTGTFEDSVRRVLTAFKVADYPPYPCFHENKVVRVVRRVQGNDLECRP